MDIAGLFVVEPTLRARTLVKQAATAKKSIANLAMRRARQSAATRDARESAPNHASLAQSPNAPMSVRIPNARCLALFLATTFHASFAAW